jgi:hypothetical protein
MWKEITHKPMTIKQRGGNSPDIIVRHTSYIPIPIREAIKILKKNKKTEKDIDYDITREQFHQILNKASQPIKDKDNGKR